MQEISRALDYAREGHNPCFADGAVCERKNLSIPEAWNADSAVDDVSFQELLAPYNFELPEELIAKHPLPERHASRLLVVQRTHRSIEASQFESLPRRLARGDLIVFNDTRVSFRRLKLRQGAREFEPLLLEFREGEWHALVRRAARLKAGSTLLHEPSGTLFRMSGRSDEKVKLKPENPPPDWEEFFQQYGDVPIPPYLNRASTPEDRTRYNTVFAAKPGSVAAPTAGLHFTPEIFERLKEAGIEHTFVNLEIGTGTFAPLKPENFAQNRLHTERFSISEGAAEMLEKSGRIIAAGTTALRALESVKRQKGRFECGDFETNLFLRPPDTARSLHGLITNFHLPESSLFMLVCAFAGTELMQAAYKKAVQERFRFYSYGDAMLII